MKCPTCHGTGAIKEPKKPETEERRTRAIKLRKAGYSLREIAALLNLKSQNSVVHLLKAPPKGKSL